jgi:hypothetical protein
MIKISLWFNEMFLENVWGWAHALGGILLGKIFLGLGLTNLHILIIAACLGIAWEILEILTAGTLEHWIQVYGTLHRAVCDSLGDIILLVLACFLTIL